MNNKHYTHLIEWDTIRAIGNIIDIQFHIYQFIEAKLKRIYIYANFKLKNFSALSSPFIVYYV